MVKECPSCGFEVGDDLKFCGKCGSSLEDNQSQVQDSNTQDVKPVNATSESPNQVKTTGTSDTKKYNMVMLVGYITSLVFPIVGLIIGLYMLTRDEKEVHVHGIIMIVLSLLIMVIAIILIIIMVTTPSHTYSTYHSPSYYGPGYSYSYTYR